MKICGQRNYGEMVGGGKDNNNSITIIVVTIIQIMML